MDEFGRVESSRDESDGANVNHEQNDVGAVKLTDTLEQAGCADNKATVKHYSGVNEGSRITGNKNE